MTDKPRAKAKLTVAWATGETDHISDGEQTLCGMPLQKMAPALPDGHWHKKLETGEDPRTWCNCQACLLAHARRGIYRKFIVTRADGSSGPGGKHHECNYFVLDVEHDQFAAPALKAYAKVCARKFPELARDIRKLVKTARVPRLGSPSRNMRLGAMIHQSDYSERRANSASGPSAAATGEKRKP